MMQQDTLASSLKNRDRYEFLPAALEILETPPAPFGRIIAITLAAFFSLAVLWAWLGSVDVVAIAQGKIIPNGKIKIVQPLETGVVRAIHVREGQSVKQNDLLIELDPTESAANIDILSIDLAQARLNIASGVALLALDPINAFNAPPHIGFDLVEAARDLLIDEFARHKATLLAIRSGIVSTESMIRSAEIEHNKLEQTIPLVEERLAAQESLLAKGISQKSIVLALRQDLYEQQAALASTTETRARNLAKIGSLKAREVELVTSFRAKAREKRRDGLYKVAILEQNLRKERQRLRYRELRAPVSGVAHQLAVHTIGAVVNSAAQLLTIVPQDAPLEIEAMVLNKDIGFIKKGQDTEIKLEAFPFTRYGTIKGKLVSISDDAIIHERFGPVYKAKISLDSQQIHIDGKAVDLSPGMNASVEIKTGSRRIIDFFLSPLMRYKDEAMRER